MTLDVLFVNHLPLRSASTYRQAGFAKYLLREGYRNSFLGREYLTSLSAGKEEQSQPEWSAFSKITYWKEPLVPSCVQNIRILSSEAQNASVIHVNRANPFSASLVSLAKSRQRPLVVDMEDWDGFGGYSSYANKHGPPGWLMTFYESTFPRKADAVLVVSQVMYSHFAKSGSSLPPSASDEELLIWGFLPPQDRSFQMDSRR